MSDGTATLQIEAKCTHRVAQGEKKPLQSYNDHAICWKCGNNQIKSDYCAGPRPQLVCWRSVMGRTEEHLHRQCPDCGHFWFESVLEMNETSRPVDREADAELGGLVRRMARAGMALYRTAHLNWSVRVWKTTNNEWVSLPYSGDSPEEVLQQAFAEMPEADEASNMNSTQNIRSSA
jgi:predicted  nucleic acid-binding Zn-ribbon protein